MNDARNRFCQAWAALPERDPAYSALLGQVENYLGDSSPESWDMPDGQRLSISWTPLRDEAGGVRDDGLRIVFERHRLHSLYAAVWKPIAPTLIVGLYSTSREVGWPAGAINGAILRHGLRQIKLECVQGKWVVEGRGELTYDVFYETLMELLRLEEVKLPTAAPELRVDAPRA